MRPRVTVSLRPDGAFEVSLNEAGRELLVDQLQRLNRSWDHFHLDYYRDPDIADATEVRLSAAPYHPGNRVLENGKVLFRPDDWDEQFFPHVMRPPATEES